MARNRQRARERKERLHRGNVPGELDHASGQVDDVEAGIVAGAEGEAAGVDDAELEREAREAAPPELRKEPAPAAGGGAGNGRDGGAAVTARDEGGSAPTEGRGGSRFLQFLKACWAELKRVQWPDRRQVAQATAVVLGFVIVAGLFLGLTDFVAEEIVDIIL